MQSCPKTLLVSSPTPRGLKSKCLPSTVGAGRQPPIFSPRRATKRRKLTRSALVPTLVDRISLMAECVNRTKGLPHIPALVAPELCSALRGKAADEGTGNGTAIFELYGLRKPNPANIFFNFGQFFIDARQFSRAVDYMIGSIRQRSLYKR